MISFLLGALAMLAIVTFAPPAVAAKPSEWLRAAWHKLREYVGPNQDG